MSEHPWTDLIRTWFGDTLHDPGAIPGRMPWWFGPDADRDADLAKRFTELVNTCAAGQHYRWLEHPEGRLATVIGLDQLPRNLYRGEARAFSHDPHTASLCLAAAATGEDRKLLPIQRAFLYMPLQHAEDLAAQDAGVDLYRNLAEETPEFPIFRDGFLPYAVQHRDIIAQFGRFPHRNAVLGRQNTPQEKAYLDGGAPTFGQ